MKKKNYFLNQNIQCNKLLIFHTFVSGYFEINRNIPRGFIHWSRTHSSCCFWIIGINILSLLCCLIFLFIDAGNTIQSYKFRLWRCFAMFEIPPKISQWWSKSVRNFSQIVNFNSNPFKSIKYNFQIFIFNDELGL